MDKVRLVLADNHQQMIAIVRRTLGEEFEVLGAVEYGEQAVNAVLTLNPDALVIDISMPILSGVQAAKQLQTANCRTRIIFLSIYDGQIFVTQRSLQGWLAMSPRLTSPPTSSQQFAKRCWASLYIRVATDAT